MYKNFEDIRANLERGCPSMIRSTELFGGGFLHVYNDGSVFKIDTNGKKTREEDLTREELKKIEEEIEKGYKNFMDTFTISQKKTNEAGYE